MKWQIIAIFLIAGFGIIKSQNPLDDFASAAGSVQQSDIFFFGQMLEKIRSIIELEGFEEVNDTRCLDQLRNYSQRARDGEEWAIRMFDATAKPQTGILIGHIMHVGSYDECLAIRGTIEDDIVQGEYCTALMSPHREYGKAIQELLDNTSLPLMDAQSNDDLIMGALKSYGFCVPAACSAASLEKIFDIIEIRMESPVNFTFVDRFCLVEDNSGLPTAAVVGICIFGFFAIIIVLSTFYDMSVYQKRREKGESLLIAFSLYTNTKKLFMSKGSDQFGCLNGIRVLSMAWILYSHTFQYTLYTPKTNSLEGLKWRDGIENVFVPAGEMAVDTFFTISGLLVAYLFLKHHRNGNKVNLPMYYVHRILRLTPSLAMAVLFTATLLKHMGDGPFWPIIKEIFQKSCEENWWATLLYIQNWTNHDEECLGQCWYLAVDTQMYFIAPLLLIPMLKYPRAVLGAIGLYVVAESAYVYYISILKDFGVVVLGVGNDDRALIYIPTYIRGTIYLIGMVTGYIFFKTENKKIRLSKPIVCLLWILSIGVLLGNCLLQYPVLINCKSDCAIKQALYNTFSRTTWAVAVSVICWLCVNNYGGIINSFLCTRIFTVLIRVNYNVYLLHLNVMAYVVARERTSSYFSNLITYHEFCGHYIFSTVAGIIWTLAFESPVIHLEKILLKNSKEKNTKSIPTTATKNDVENSGNSLAVVIDKVIKKH